MNQLNLNNQLKNQDFVAKTISQIEKDFGRCNLEIHLANLSDRDSLENGILSLIQNLSSDKLQQLMYIIDIQENDYSKLLRTEFFHRALAEKILRREALKVFLRENLSI
ncbi:MAG: hypothetical protein FJZ67_01235 [Bacteroidetes bacterium]|nr:hypothetical protein [Bacteroidota bacterium]